MGQRHQIIVIYPEMFLNKGNCNNKPERAEVIHHQWLYGRGAILALERVLKLVANSWDGDGGAGTDYLFGREDRGYAGGDGTRAIAAAISVDPDDGYYHNVWIWEPAEWNGGEKGGRAGDIASIRPQSLKPEMFDNNDGMTVIRFECGQKLPKVAFIMPGGSWEESNGNGPFSPVEYLGFYYSAQEQREWEPDTRERMEKAFANISGLSRPMEAEELASLLPHFEIKVSKPSRKRKPSPKRKGFVRN